MLGVGAHLDPLSCHFVFLTELLWGARGCRWARASCLWKLIQWEWRVNALEIQVQRWGEWCSFPAVPLLTAGCQLPDQVSGPAKAECGYQPDGSFLDSVNVSHSFLWAQYLSQCPHTWFLVRRKPAPIQGDFTAKQRTELESSVLTPGNPRHSFANLICLCLPKWPYFPSVASFPFCKIYIFKWFLHFHNNLNWSFLSACLLFPVILGYSAASNIFCYVTYIFSNEGKGRIMITRKSEYKH